MNQEHIEITSYEGEGYRPVIDYQTWRVAILNYCEELEVPNLRTMQKHMKTDEVFVLLRGNCVLFAGGTGEDIDLVEAVLMKPLQLYNVKRGVWHTHTLDQDGMVLIVENKDTCDDNSPTKPMSEDQIKQLKKLYENVMGS